MCEMLKISVQGRNYARIKNSIQKLAQTSFLFELKDGNWSVERILSKAKGSKNYGTIEVDQWFFSHFLKNEITRLDMNFRQSLRGDIVKCLYRFLISHRGVQRYYTETLIEALNMNQDRDIRFNRRALKSAFGQLRNRGFLSFIYNQKSDLFDNIELNKKLLLHRTK
jgi:hypothetical protein